MFTKREFSKSVLEKVADWTAKRYGFQTPEIIDNKWGAQINMSPDAGSQVWNTNTNETLGSLINRKAHNATVINGQPKQTIVRYANTVAV